MSKRVMGTEVEYGIAGPGDPVVASTQVVLAYAAAAGVPRNRRARWDYEAESPLRDARGFDLSKPSLAPQRDTDMDDVGAANVILPNGARFYVDHAHPEYSTPEVLTPRDVVVWDKAGERIMLEAANRAATVPDAPRIQLYKNNVDGKGASYGSHENYLMSRATTFPSIVTGLTPFLVSRQVVCGAGRVGLGQQGDEPGFQIAQRSDYIEVEVGLETTLKRGIINTRDEPHADADKYRRLHVIIGDANLSEVATLLKVGTTALVLDMIEHGRSFEDLRLAEPVKSVARISHDLTLHTTIPLADGRRFTALNLQQEYLTRAVAHLEQTAGSRRTDWNPDTREVVEEWESVLADLERDPMLTTDRLDWTAKLQLLEAYRERDGLRWGSGRLGMVDLQYSDVRLAKGLYNRLVTRGSMRRVVTEEEVTAAMTEPPEDTRAYFRGTCLSRYPADVAAASWSSVIFDLDRESLVRIPTPEPLRGTRRHVGELFETVADAAELVDKLTGKQPGAAPADQAGIAGRFWK